MRVSIRVAGYALEYEGPATVWNDRLRPLLGGPEAGDTQSGGPEPPEPADSAARSESTASAGQSEPEASPLDTKAIYDKLAAAEGRRGEKDAVLVAAWEQGGATRDVPFDDIARAVHAHDAFRDVRVKPHVLKHVSRTRMLEPGTERETVRLTRKGRRYVESLGSQEPR